MTPKLYMLPASPPVRAVLMVAKALNLEFEIIEVDLMNGGNKTPEYLKMNPQHTIPTLVEEDGFILWDSHAIITYLVSKYSKDDALYPKDLKKRALVDQRLHFESGVAFPKIVKVMYPIIFKGKNKLEQGDLDILNEVYQFVEAFLEGKEWFAGDSVTVADYSLISNLCSATYLYPADVQKFPKLNAWFKKVEALPAYEANKLGFEAFKNLMKSKLM